RGRPAPTVTPDDPAAAGPHGAPSAAVAPSPLWSGWGQGVGWLGTTCGAPDGVSGTVSRVAE
ncbi:MAG: hypothetical protein U1C73_03960, partial [Dietzia sp.]|nr:hypothetical protein [Dietzia sp.]